MPTRFGKTLASDEYLIEDLFKEELFPKNWQALVDTIVLALPQSGAALAWRSKPGGDVEIISAGLGRKAKATLRNLMASGTLESTSGRNPREPQMTLSIGDDRPGVLFVASRAPGSARLKHLRKELAVYQRELRRAFALLISISERRRALDRINRLLEARASPTLIVGDAGEILASNVRARRAIAESRLLELGGDGKLLLKAERAREPLSASLSRIERPTLLGGGAPASRSENGAAQDLLVVMPLPEGRDPDVASTKEFVLSIRKLFSPSSISSRNLGASFGLTHAEARLVAALASGAVVSRYARDNKIKESTVRWHLRNALEKTGCRTHTDLIRLALFLVDW
jgi:DNA-binding CsgD family transcriptional regulator